MLLLLTFYHARIRMTLETMNAIGSLKKNIKDNPMLAVVIVFYMSTQVWDRLDQKGDKLVYEIKRSMKITLMESDYNRLEMELGHMRSYVQQGNASGFQKMRYETIPREKEKVIETIEKLKRAKYGEDDIDALETRRGTQ